MFSALPGALNKNEVETRKLAQLLQYITWPNPENIVWPPTLPEEAPWWWPNAFEWPPRLPDDLVWPPSLPDDLVWPPTLPEEAPAWWPKNCAWPPQIPESILENGPCWWPEGLTWPPPIPDISWPQLPDIPWPPQLPGIIVDQIPYIPNRDNQLHLFTRANPGLSQPILNGNLQILQNSNFDSSRRTIILVHDLGESALADSNLVLIPSLLQAADVNVILVDWSAGAKASPLLSTFYSWLSGNFVARFIRWLSTSTNSDLENFHLIGMGIGALNVGYIGRVLNKEIGYITGETNLALKRWLKYVGGMINS
ncbi:unnamed protein product [Diatraea saccharalis]|uniref:Lipase domain-containing protein n=1 Tax=Diatraea saccharalis TaxID=40085 RepID=A0A9N9WF69_9NEOP|nr:unnamed protein product [Diatraea saccharalis]